MFTNLVTFLAEEPVHKASQDTAELIVGGGCILLVVVVMIFWAHSKKK